MAGEESHPFCRPKGLEATCHIMIGNCSPLVGVPEQAIQQMLDPYGPATITLTGKSHVFASFACPQHATAALQALDGKPSPAAGNRSLVVKFADIKKDKKPQELPLSAVLTAAESGVPGLELHPEFVSQEEEEALLTLVDSQPWQTLAKRRVQHYGFEFHYESRNVDCSAPRNPIPQLVQPIVQRIEALPSTPTIDQLTVNEYPLGVGLAPHIDTHSAFTGAIISLSLGGPAVMVMRRGKQQVAVALPRRALLVMAGESRYAWQHYIPHRKSDVVGGEVVARAPRRVSFTFRQIRGFPCDCTYPEHCDSQESTLPPTRMAALKNQGGSRCSADSGSGGNSSGSGSQAGSNAGGSDGKAVTPGCEAGRGWLAPEGVRAGSAAAAVAGAAVAAAATSSATPYHVPDQAHHPGQPASSSNGSSSVDHSLELASVDRQLAELEERYVHSVYNAIAPHFSATRFAVWPKVRAFIDSLPPGSVVADVGCGNGKYFGVRSDIFVMGSDRSHGLAHVASRRLQPGAPPGERLRADVAVADALCLPYRPASCDGVLCIAVLHHISSEERRLRLLRQLLALLVPGGRALVTVWATQQENMSKVRKWQSITTPASGQQQLAVPASDAAEEPSSVGTTPPVAGAAATAAAAAAGGDARGAGAPMAAAGEGVSSGDYFVPWHLPLHRAEAAAAAATVVAAAAPTGTPATSSSSSAGTAGTAAAGAPAAAAAGAPQLDNSKGAVVYQRYYHLFEEGELDALVRAVPGARLAESFYDRDNWCAVMERVG